MKRVYQHVLILLILCAAIASCEDANDLSNTCDVSNPIADLPWLKEQIDLLNQHEDKESVATIYYATAKYKGETVFYNWNCSPIVNFASLVVDCDGELIAFTNDIYDDLTEIRRIWEYQNNKCQ